MKKGELLRAHYQAPKTDKWQGRGDGPRFHQIVHPVDLSLEAANESPGFMIIGFACDEGIRRNLGRTGAAHGPDAIRKALSGLPVHFQTPFYEAGEITCLNGDLESAQAALGESVAFALNQKHFPIVLGGGHEIAWGHYQGIRAAHPNINLGIINLDAHLDMRPLLDSGQGSSGTPFWQIAKHSQEYDHDFNYLCVGVQPLGNTEVILNNAKTYNTQIITADSLRAEQLSAMAILNNFIAQVDAIYFTICLDVFSQSAAPGVSAPQPFGLMPYEVEPILKIIAKSGKLLTMDIAELCPALDKDETTARLAAHLIAKTMSYAI